MLHLSLYRSLPRHLTTTRRSARAAPSLFSPSGLLTSPFTTPFRGYSAKQEAENLNVQHSQFLSESSAQSRWKNEGHDKSGDDFDNVREGKGKLSSTTSHLFKLVLPLGSIASKFRGVEVAPADSKDTPTVFLLHPSQPISHASRLILASLPGASSLDLSFRSISPNGQALQWSDSTDIGDFVRDAARATEFAIHITRSKSSSSGSMKKSDKDQEASDQEHIITVEVPSFADRTRFLRLRLKRISKEIENMEGMKTQCDREAHRGAQRMAIGGLGMLVVYWGGVARLTFWDYGWDVMEPITYLSGLSTVICGYLWFLYQGREVSYSSILDRSVSSRRAALYKSRGIDIDHWNDLLAEARSLRNEIAQIAQDYDHSWKEAQRDSEQRARRDNENEDKSDSGADSLNKEERAAMTAVGARQER
ncbi:hypothetical protein OF83DRAFT_1051124 [Amylostereum chailletii]|nr:hypothetical protein OF83DRAFT_1051124 [Amylostereum chailletii]